HGARRLTLYRNRFPDDIHRLPAALILVLHRVCWVDVVDIEVFTIGAEGGESPGAELVVADGDAGYRWLAAADDVPAGRDQMDPVAQRRRLLVAMRVVHHERVTARGQLRTDDPVVAPDVLPAPAEIESAGRLDDGAVQPGRRARTANNRRRFAGRKAEGRAES